MQRRGHDSKSQKTLRNILLESAKVSHKIFSYLGSLEDLKACRQVTRVWRYYVDNHTDFWSRVQNNCDDSGLTTLHLAARSGDFKVCR